MSLLLGTGKNQEIINGIIDYLDNNYTDIFCKQGLEDKFGIHYAHLRRLFRKKNYMSIIDYINKKRVELAIILLTDRCHRMKDIASNVGFVNQSNFCAAFKKHSGVTPLKYRDQRKLAG